MLPAAQMSGVAFWKTPVVAILPAKHQLLNKSVHAFFLIAKLYNVSTFISNAAFYCC